MVFFIIPNEISFASAFILTPRKSSIQATKDLEFAGFAIWKDAVVAVQKGVRADDNSILHFLNLTTGESTNTVFEYVDAGIVLFYAMLLLAFLSKFEVGRLLLLTEKLVVVTTIDDEKYVTFYPLAFFSFLDCFSGLSFLEIGTFSMLDLFLLTSELGM
jgi:hypothetical protein